MYFSTSLVLTLAAAGQLVSAALPKANEYQSGDCSGALNYGHHRFDLKEVTMDDSTHSVYQAGVNWYLFDGKEGNGGHCTGRILGQVDGKTSACLNLDTTFGGSRIRCLCNPLVGMPVGGLNPCDFLASK